MICTHLGYKENVVAFLLVTSHIFRVITCKTFLKMVVFSPQAK